MEFDLSIVVACYHDAPHLAANVRRIQRILEQTRYRYEYVFVEDAGNDGSVEILEALTKELEDARLIIHEKNTGRGRAVTDGFRLTRGKVVGFLDIDLAVSPVYIPLMVSSILDDGYDVATAHRIYLRTFRPFAIFRDFLSYAYRILVWWYLSINFKDTETGYKFFRRESLMPLLEYAEDPGWFWDTEIMALANDFGLKIVELPCLFVRDADKTSAMRLRRDIPRYIRAMRAFRRRRSRISEGRKEG